MGDEMSAFKFGHNPLPVTLDFIKRLDDEEPGKYFASHKLNGFRRFAQHTNGRWIWRAKPAGAGALKPLPPDLQAAFENMNWPAEITLDMEWVGPAIRKEAKENRLYVFDLLGTPLPFVDRMNMLEVLWFRVAPKKGSYPSIQRVKYVPNPGIVDLFQQSLTMPNGEGIVVRSASQVNTGHPSVCTEHGHMYKLKHKPMQQEKIR